ncbi:MAG: hypothetical protein COB36_10040 [Alphaproteobacteria bacterium]|nr:MAG: hypothetical protein COB36_10040 [Alphaproteobacteria bacterium]
MITETTEQQKEYFGNLLSAFEGQYLLTLELKRSTSDVDEFKLLQQFVISLNNSVFMNRRPNKEHSLKGFVVTEKPRSSPTVLYHLLIAEADYSLPPLARLRRMTQKAVTDSQRRLRSEGIVGFTLRDYADHKNSHFGRYVSRKFQFKSMRWNRSKEAVGLLSPKGVLFGRDRFA